jgi:hypothetical protein
VTEETTMHKLTCIVIAAATWLAFPAGAAAAPEQINFAARLSDGTGPAQGSITVTFELYRAATGGAAIWGESQALVATDGLVTAVLGTQSPIDATIADGAALYLEVAVDGQILSPRLGMASVPYAIRAAVAEDAEAVGGLGPAQLQQRVTGACPGGQSIRAIAQDGTATCEPDDDTTYSAGFGLAASGTTFAVNNTAIQERVAQTCAPGAAIRQINQNGSVVCEVDDDTNTTYTAGPGLFLQGGTQFRIAALLSYQTTASSPTAVGTTSGVHAFCALTMVSTNFLGADPNTGRYCEVLANANGTWTVFARASSGSSVTCRMMCF